MTQQTETITGDKLIYDYPGRTTALYEDGDRILDVETFGLPEFHFEGRVEGREKFVDFYPPDGKVLAVEISYREVELVSGETGREGTYIEDIFIRQD